MSKTTSINPASHNSDLQSLSLSHFAEFHSERDQEIPVDIVAPLQPTTSILRDQNRLLGSNLDPTIRELIPAIDRDHTRTLRENSQRIALSDAMGITMVDVDSILCAIAFSNYTELHLQGGQRFVVSRTLKTIVADLPGELFIRIHASHLVALSAITRYIRGNGGMVVLANGEQFPVSRAKKDELLERLGAH